MIYYIPYTMVYAIEREELSDIVSATDENLARTTYFGSSTDFRRTYFAGHRNTNILYTLIKRLLGFCTITPPPPPHTYIQFAVSRAKRPELVYRFRDPKGTFKKTVSQRSIIPHRVRTDANRPSDVNYVNKNEYNKGSRAYSDRIMRYIHVYIYILYVFNSLPLHHHHHYWYPLGLTEYLYCIKYKNIQAYRNAFNENQKKPIDVTNTILNNIIIRNYSSSINKTQL